MENIPRGSNSRSISSFDWSKHISRSRSSSPIIKKLTSDEKFAPSKTITSKSGWSFPQIITHRQGIDHIKSKYKNKGNDKSKIYDKPKFFQIRKETPNIFITERDKLRKKKEHEKRAQLWRDRFMRKGGKTVIKKEKKEKKEKKKKGKKNKKVPLLKRI